MNKYEEIEPPNPEGLGELRFNLRHRYTITREPVRKGTRVNLTIFADDKIIAERTTALPYLCAMVCSHNQAYHIASLQQWIPWLRQMADLKDRIQLRDPAALAADTPNPYDLQPGLYTYIDREKMIQEGAFAEMAKHDRALADIEEARLKRLSAGPVEEFDRLFVCGWRRRRSLARGLSHQLKLEDILEIPTGLPAALPWP